MRPCLELGCTELTNLSRCPLHAKVKERKRGTPTQRGYGYRYQQERAAVLHNASRCAICGLPPTATDPLTADHIVPLSRGGGIEGNLRPAHRSCNSGRRT